MIGEVRYLLEGPARPDSLGPLLERLDEARSRLDRRTPERNGEITAGEAGALPGWHNSARIGLPRPEVS